MTFKQLQDAVIADAFDESKRADVQNWINHRYTWLCDLEEWSFLKRASTVTVTSGSAAVTGLPTGLGPVNGLLDQYGSPLEAVRDNTEFYGRYTNPTSLMSGQPEAFTVVGGAVLVGPVSNVTSSLFTLLDEQVATLLVNDTDVPVVPAGYHIGLVQGGKAEGFRLTNIPLAEQFDQDFRGTIDAMRGKYLRPIRDGQRQSPAYRPC